MKVGDLVKLSAYGRSVRRTRWVFMDDVGIIREVRKIGLYTCYKVLWNKSECPPYWSNALDRRDLKYVGKASKKG